MASNGLKSPGLEADKCNWPRKSRMQRNGSSRLQNEKQPIQLTITNTASKKENFNYQKKKFKKMLLTINVYTYKHGRLRDGQDGMKLHVIINKYYAVYYDNNKRCPAFSYQRSSNGGSIINLQEAKEYLQRLLCCRKPIDLGCILINIHWDTGGSIINLQEAKEYLQRLLCCRKPIDLGCLLINIHWDTGGSIINLPEAKEYLQRLLCCRKPIDLGGLLINVHWDTGESINLCENKEVLQNQVPTDQNRQKYWRKQITSPRWTIGERINVQKVKEYLQQLFFYGKPIDCSNVLNRHTAVGRGTLLQEIFPYGVPMIDQNWKKLIIYKYYAVYYDDNKKHPVFSYQHFIDGELKSYKNPSQLVKIKVDYKEAGEDWSRGHMTPRGDLPEESRREADEYTNIVPQNRNNNSGIWNMLERFISKLALYCSDIYVFTGPLYMQSIVLEKIGKVPSDLFKVVLCVKEGKKYLGTYVIPNKDVKEVKEAEGGKTEDRLTDYYQADVKYWQMRFFPELKDYYELNKLSRCKFGKYTKVVKKYLPITV